MLLFKKINISKCIYLFTYIHFHVSVHLSGLFEYRMADRDSHPIVCLFRFSVHHMDSCDRLMVSGAGRCQVTAVETTPPVRYKCETHSLQSSLITGKVSSSLITPPVCPCWCQGVWGQVCLQGDEGRSLSPSPGCETGSHWSTVDWGNASQARSLSRWTQGEEVL